MTSAKNRITEWLQTADIRIDGDRPWDLQVYNDELFDRIIQQGSLGLGEAYMEGWWDAEQLDVFFFRVLRVMLERKVAKPSVDFWHFIKSLVLNPQRKSRAYEVGEHHYDLGNDLYKAMLDNRMTYTCGYWDETDSLEEAQEHKLNTVCDILNLQPGQRILDIGCGWGSFTQYAAQNYGVEVVGITVSRQQMNLARKRCEDLPVEIRLQDYREVDEPFDHVVSLGMFEHVGVKNYRSYMEVVDRCLKQAGAFVLHTIGGNVSARKTDSWIEKYIFPNSMIPTIAQIGRAIEGLFTIEHMSNHGPDYDRTLMAWYRNFSNCWDHLKKNYGERFYRMWKYYLLSSAGSFRARKNHQWQIVLTKAVRRPNGE